VGFLSGFVQANGGLGRVRIQNAGETTLVFIAPPNPEGPDPSRFFDAAAEAADLLDGRLFVGEAPLWIRYRDAESPGGYDAGPTDSSAGASADGHRLVDVDGTRDYPEAELTAEDLPGLLARMELLRDPRPARPTRAFALMTPRLFPLALRYLSGHHMRTRAARLRDGDGRGWVLADFAPRNGDGAPVPDFVRSFLEKLPRCAVLTEADIRADGLVLVGVGTRFPLPDIRGALPADGLSLFPADPQFPALTLSPAPVFLDGDALLSLEHDREYRTASAADGAAPETVRVPLRLVPDPHRTRPLPEALVLRTEELAWLYRMVNRLPGAAFADYALCVGNTHGVLMGERGVVEGIPFGRPLRRHRGGSLFLPLGTRLTPEVGWPVLSEVLELRDGVSTFLLPDLRIDVPEAEFFPLSRLLVAEPGRPRLALEIRPPARLPELKWTPPGTAQPTERSGRDEDRNGNTWFQKLAERVRPGSGKAGTPGDTRTTDPVPEDAPSLEKMAAERADQGDWAEAALFYTLLGESGPAARYFRQAAANPTDGEEPGSAP
jgi:hypothetical protein